MRKTGRNGIDLIRAREGTVLSVYLDSRGLPTVGTGHLVRYADGLKLGDHITEDRAEKFLENDLGIAEAAVNRYCPDLPTQNAFDALVDFTFNEGTGNLRQLVQNADGVPTVIAEHFSHYTRSGTDHPRGLRIRRALERDLFLAPEGPMPDEWLMRHNDIA